MFICFVLNEKTLLKTKVVYTYLRLHEKNQTIEIVHTSRVFHEKPQTIEIVYTSRLFHGFLKQSK